MGAAYAGARENPGLAFSGIQKLLLQPGQEISNAPDQTFDENVKLAQKVPDVHERDGLIATAVLGTNIQRS